MCNNNGEAAEGEEKGRVGLRKMWVIEYIGTPAFWVAQHGMTPFERCVPPWSVIFYFFFARVRKNGLQKAGINLHREVATLMTNESLTYSEILKTKEGYQTVHTSSLI